MKNSIFMVMLTVIACGTMANADYNRNDKNYKKNYDKGYEKNGYNKNNERRGGMFGNGGILGTGVGRDRRHDYQNGSRSESRRNEGRNRFEQNKNGKSMSQARSASKSK